MQAGRHLDDALSDVFDLSWYIQLLVDGIGGEAAVAKAPCPPGQDPTSLHDRLGAEPVEYAVYVSRKHIVDIIVISKIGRSTADFASDSVLSDDLPADLLVDIEFTRVLRDETHLVDFYILDSVFVAFHLFEDFAFLVVSLVLEKICEGDCFVDSFLGIGGSPI